MAGTPTLHGSSRRKSVPAGRTFLIPEATPLHSDVTMVATIRTEVYQRKSFSRVGDVPQFNVRRNTTRKTARCNRYARIGATRTTRHRLVARMVRILLSQTWIEGGVMLIEMRIVGDTKSLSENQVRLCPCPSVPVRVPGFRIGSKNSFLQLGGVPTERSHSQHIQPQYSLGSFDLARVDACPTGGLLQASGSGRTD